MLLPRSWSREDATVALPAVVTTLDAWLLSGNRDLMF
jgi:hypothetical protein